MTKAVCPPVNFAQVAVNGVNGNTNWIMGKLR